MTRLWLVLAAMSVVAILAAACGEDKIITVEKEVVKEIEVPGETVIVEKVVEVEVPGETVIVEKQVVKEVEVPGETVIVEKEVVKEVEVPGETVIVEKEVEVPGETVVVEVEKVLIATPTAIPAGEPRFGGTLKVVMHAGTTTLDPVFSQFQIVGNVATQMYENIFAWDGNLEPAPRLAHSFSLSSDLKTYTITIRDGVTFHDGTAFTAADAAQSIRRWRTSGNPAAGIIRRFTDEHALNVVNDLTFTWDFTEPIGAAIFILAIPHGMLPVMKQDLAETPFSVSVEDHIGTGVFKFVEWDIGDKITFERFENHVSRTEPFTPGTYAGENIAYLDKLVLLEVPDAETQIAGLETGEWDMVEYAGLDFFDRTNNNPDLQVLQYKPGLRSNVYLNPQIAPFSYKLARQALQTAIKVEDFMFALGPEQAWIVCPALYYCGTPLETDAGSTFDVVTSQGVKTIGYNVNDIETAKLLLNDSDYAGETTIILNPTDLAVLTPLGHVLKPVMEETGFNVEMPALDWATITTMFGNTDTFAAATDAYQHFSYGNPIQDHLISGTYDFIIRDEDLGNLQLDYVRELDPEKQFLIAEEIQRQRWEKVTSLSLGQYFPIHPSTRAMKNFAYRALPYFGNVWLER